ncbi:MAG TPA: hypothetical protein VJM32_05510 [Candidatus Saccharimonadales bacterium]|nr:hypothetical protein [Candidatus Saccharimonadales bacterium]
MYNFEIRVFGEGIDFPYGKAPQTYVTFRSFASISQELAEQATRFEVLADVPPNSQVLAAELNSDTYDAENQVETNATGTYVAVVGTNLEMVKLAWQSYIGDLSRDLASILYTRR